MTLKTTAFLLFLIANLMYASAYSPVDSLIEEATYQYQVLCNVDKAGQIYARILSEFADDHYAVESARRGLKFCQAVTGRTFGPGIANHIDIARTDSGLPLLLWRRGYSSGSIQTVTPAGKRIALTTADGYIILADRYTGNALWARGGISGDKPPIVDGDNFYSISDKGLLICLSFGRSKALWVSDALNITSSIAQNSRKTIFCASGSHVMGVNSKNGRVNFNVDFKISSSILMRPVVCGENAIFTVPGIGVVLLDGVKGERLWSNNIEPTLLPLITRNLVILVSGTDIYALSRETGKMIWNLSANENIMSAEIADNGYVISLENSGEIRGIDPLTGEVRFTFLSSAGEVIALPGSICNLDKKGRATCRAYDGRTLWRFSTGETEGSTVSSNGEQVFIMTENSGLFALNAGYGHLEDVRISDGSIKIEAMLNSGMFRLALGQARYLLSEVEPGNPYLNRQYALLLMKNNEKEKAFSAWEKYISVAGESEINGTEAGDELRAISGAKWVTAISGAGKFTPFYRVKDNIIVLCEGAISVIHSATGKIVWKYRLPSSRSIPQSAVSYNENLFFFCDNEISGLNLDAQKTLWHTRINGNPTSLCISGNYLYVGTWNNGLFELNLKTGKEERRLYRDIKALFPLSDKNKTIFCVGLEGIITAINGNREIFSVVSEDRFLAIPQTTGNALIVPTAQGYINAYSTRNGALLWSERMGVQASSITIDDSRVYAVFTNQTQGAFNLHDGSRLWMNQSRGESPEMISNSYGLLAVSGDNRINLVNAENGEGIKTLRTAGRISSVLQFGAVLFARLENGLLYRFDGK